MKYLSVFFIFIVFSCSKPKVGSQVRVGIDTDFSKIQSVEIKNNATGFIKDLLQGINGIEFDLINDDSDNLTKGLSDKKYDIIFSTLLPYNFNQNDYNFSTVAISLSPHPVIRKTSNIKNLKDFKNKIIGILESDLRLIDFKDKDDWNLKIYTSSLQALNDLIDNKIDIALIGFLDALSYSEDTFYGQIEVLDIPLNQQGYRFISLKDNYSNIIRLLNDKLDDPKKENMLLQKWKLKTQSS